MLVPVKQLLNMLPMKSETSAQNIINGAERHKAHLGVRYSSNMFYATADIVSWLQVKLV